MAFPAWRSLLSFLERVERNKGSHGMDEMSIQKLRRYILNTGNPWRWNSFREPMKCNLSPGSKSRNVTLVQLLGIPTVTDGLIQQAIAQVLTLIYDPTFLGHSYGFRPSRSAHDAVKEAKDYIQEGYRWGVLCKNYAWILRGENIKRFTFYSSCPRLLCNTTITQTALDIP